MKALILDGSKWGDEVLETAHNIVKETLEGMSWEVNSFVLRDIKIAPCLGCFDCWLKTPGICVTNDAGRNTTSVAVQSDLWIFLTSVTFGGYSFELKKAVDRFLPIFIPVFTKVNGEVHHRLRYKKHPKLIGIGHSIHESRNYDDIFKKLISRNAINFRSPSQSAEILLSNFTIEQIRERVLRSLFNVGIT